MAFLLKKKRRPKPKFTKQGFWMVKMVQHWILTLLDHNFVTIGPILTNLVPICSHDKGLSNGSNGTKMVKIGPVVTKLWYQQVGTQNVTNLGGNQNR